jgi:WD40 repeat protein
MKTIIGLTVILFATQFHNQASPPAGQKLELVVQTGHSSGVGHVSVSPDGKILASNDYSTIILWDIANRKELHSLGGLTGVNSIAFSQDGKLLAGSSDKSIKLWDVVSGKEVRSFQCCFDKIFAMAFSPDGKKLLSGGSDYTIKSWSVHTGQELQTFSIKRASSLKQFALAFAL